MLLKINSKNIDLTSKTNYRSKSLKANNMEIRYLLINKYYIRPKTMQPKMYINQIHKIDNFIQLDYNSGNQNCSQDINLIKNRTTVY